MKATVERYLDDDDESSVQTHALSSTFIKLLHPHQDCTEPTMNELGTGYTKKPPRKRRSSGHWVNVVNKRNYDNDHNGTNVSVNIPVHQYARMQPPKSRRERHSYSGDRYYRRSDDDNDDDDEYSDGDDDQYDNKRPRHNSKRYAEKQQRKAMRMLIKENKRKAKKKQNQKLQKQQQQQHLVRNKRHSNVV